MLMGISKKIVNALAVQNPHHKCDWETGTIITDKKIIANNTDLTIIILRSVFPPEPFSRVGHPAKIY